MKVLILVPVLSTKPKSGRDLRNWHNIQACAASFETVVVGFGKVCEKPKVPNLKGWYSANCGETEGQIVPFLKKVIEDHSPDMVLIENPLYYPFVMSLGLPIVVDFHNIESRLHFQMGEAEPWWNVVRKLKLYKTAKKYLEIEQKIKSSQAKVLCCSSFDKEILQEQGFKAETLFVVPNTLGPKGKFLPSRPCARELSLVFVGLLSYLPNVKAVKFLVGLMRKAQTLFPKISLKIVGKKPKKFMRNLSKSLPIALHENVPDVSPHLMASNIAVFPIFEGSGTRFKILEAVTAGLPIIGTAKSAEGIEFIDKYSILFVENYSDFLKALKLLNEDPWLAEKLVKNAQEMVKKYYGFNVLTDCFRGAISAGTDAANIKKVAI